MEIKIDPALILWTSLSEKIFNWDEIHFSSGIYFKKIKNFSSRKNLVILKLRKIYVNAKPLQKFFQNFSFNTYSLCKNDFIKITFSYKQISFYNHLTLQNFIKFSNNKKIFRLVYLGIKRVFGFINKFKFKNIFSNFNEMEIDFLNTVYLRILESIVWLVFFGNTLFQKIPDKILKKLIFIEWNRLKKSFLSKNLNKDIKFLGRNGNYFPKNFLEIKILKNKNKINIILKTILKLKTEKIFLTKIKNLTPIKKKLNSFKNFFFAVFPFITKHNEINLANYSPLYYRKNETQEILKKSISFFLKLNFEKRFLDFCTCFILIKAFFPSNDIFDNQIDILKFFNLRKTKKKLLVRKKNFSEIFKIFSFCLKKRNSMIFIFSNDWLFQINEHYSRIKTILAQDLIFKKKETSFRIFIFSLHFEIKILSFLRKIKEKNFLQFFNLFFSSLTDDLIFFRKIFKITHFLSESFHFFNKFLSYKSRSFCLSEIGKNYCSNRIEVIKTESPKIKFFAKKKRSRKKKIKKVILCKLFKEFGYQKKLRSLFYSHSRDFFSLSKMKIKNSLFLNKDIPRASLHIQKIFLKIRFLNKIYLKKAKKNSNFLPIVIFRTLKLFSRFFFYKITNEQKFQWNLSSSRLLIETGGDIRKNYKSFLIFSDLKETLVLLSFNRAKLVKYSEVDVIMSSSAPHDPNKLTCRIQNGLLINIFITDKTKNVFFILGKTFKPKSTILKLPAAIEYIQIEKFDKNNKNRSDDNIYICEAFMIKILKKEFSLTSENFFIEIKKKLKINFVGDIRGFVMQVKNLNKKGYLYYFHKKKTLSLFFIDNIFIL